MKKILLIALLTFGTLSYAEDFDSFIGIQAGATNVNIDTNPSESQRGTSYGLRLGFIKDTGRVYITAQTAGLDDSDLSSIALNFDAITPRAYRFNDSFSIRGFIGLHGGAVQIKPDNFDDDEGAMGGGQAGILLDFPAEITLEIGAKGTWAAIDFGPERVKNYQNIYAAFDYTF